jgi:predicted ATPase
MITRIEIDGFKSFRDFTLDVPPLLALVGPNASGKSNLLDAIDLASSYWSAGHFDDAFLRPRRGKPQELFHRRADGHALQCLRIALDTISDTPHGPIALRFVVTADMEAGRLDSAGSGVRYLDLAQWTWLSDDARARLEHTRQVVTDAGRFHANEPGMNVAGQTFGSVARSWHIHSPEPAAMRSAVPVADQRALTETADNLAAVLARLTEAERRELEIDLAALVPGVVGVEPVLDERDQEWSFDIVVEGGQRQPSRLASDGTLRVLALLAALHDPESAGVLLIEEIENGLHPSRLAELLRRMQEHVTELDDPFSRPLRQIILTSHSPVVLSELCRHRPDSVHFLDTVTRIDPNEGTSQVTVARPVRERGEPGTFVSQRQVRQYLGTVRQVAG